MKKKSRKEGLGMGNEEFVGLPLPLYLSLFPSSPSFPMGFLARRERTKEIHEILVLEISKI